MKKLYIILNAMIIILVTPALVYAQCPTDLLQGQNLVNNGDFTQGYTGWTYTADPARTTGYAPFVPPGWSNPGNIYVGTNPVTFNPGPPSFDSYGDHTTGSGNMLMVDGICVLGIKLWQQSGIPIKPNTNYYFSVWISSLKNQPTYPGILNFDINGTNFASFTAPALGGGTGGGWVLHEVLWNSGPTPPATVTIGIENAQTTGCNTESDFAIDDIAFIPGCAYGAPGPQPSLGPDQTICGKGGSIILDSNVPHNATTTVTWSSNVTAPQTGTGMGAPYTKTITAPGTYSVCVSDNGSCTKSDIIVITNTYSVNLGPDVVLCNPSTATFDAGFTGPGVTYKWYKSYPTLAPTPNTGQTYFVNTAGTYRVDVTDPICGVQSDVVVVTSTAAVPTNGTYCTSPSTVGLSVSGPGNYKWYDTPTKGTGTIQASGLTFTTPSMTAPASATYYVEDISTASGSVGPTTFGSGMQTYANSSSLVSFTANQDFSILSMSVPLGFYYIPAAGDNFKVVVEVKTAAGASFAPAKTFTSNVTAIPNGSSTGLYTFTFTGLDIQAAWGTNLTIGVNSMSGVGGGSGYAAWYSGVAPAYPYNFNPSGVMSITGSYNGGSQPTQYGSLLNWQIQTGIPCARVPVTVTYSCPMPVGWTRFKASSVSDVVQLSWSTTFEENNRFFMVERSEDGIHFKIISMIAGAGTRNGLASYSYTDESPLAGTAYYRIGQQDYDGKTSYTSVESTSYDGIDLVNVYPNPFESGTTLMVVTGDQSDYTYSIYSVSGQVVESGTGTSGEALTVAEAITNGMYMLTINTETKTQTVKIIKK